MTINNINLIGFMGSGKTLTARALGEHLKREVISTDGLIEAREGRSIAKIFEGSGEDDFREVEGEVVREACQRKEVILDCGGGVVLDPSNVSQLKQSGTIIYLAASPETIYERIKGKAHRPLLNVGDPKKRIAELLAERKPLYEQADHTIDTDHKSVQQVCEEILKVLKKND